MRPLTFALASALIACGPPQIENFTFLDVPPSSNADYVALSTAPDGTLWLFYSAPGSSQQYEVRAAKWTETGFKSLGSVIGGIAGEPSVGVDGVARIAVGYMPFEVDIVSWTEAGSATGSHFAAPEGTSPSTSPVSIGPDGTAYFARVEGSVVSVLSASPGGQFTQLGPDVLSGVPSYIRPSALVFAPGGEPLLVWVEQDAFDFWRWNGTAWEAAFGRLSLAPSAASVPEWIIASDGTPYVAWSGSDVSGQGGSAPIYVARWTGTQWEQLGTALPQRGVFPTLRLDPTGRLYVALLTMPFEAENGIWLSRWNGTSWDALGPAESLKVGGDRSYAHSLALAFDAEGRLVIAWIETTQSLWAPSSSLYVARYTGP